MKDTALTSTIVEDEDVKEKIKKYINQKNRFLPIVLKTKGQVCDNVFNNEALKCGEDNLEALKLTVTDVRRKAAIIEVKVWDNASLQDGSRVTFGRKLTKFDRRVHDAYVSIQQCGYDVCDREFIYACLTGKISGSARPSENELNKIDDAMSKLQQTTVTIEADSEKDLKYRGKPVGGFTDTSTILQFDAVTLYGKKFYVYTRNKNPILYAYASRWGEIAKVKTEEIQTKGVRMGIERKGDLEDYLRRRIDAMVHNPNMAKRIRMDTLQQELNVEFKYKEAQTRYRKDIKTFLDKFNENGLIEGWSWVSDPHNGRKRFFAIDIVLPDKTKNVSRKCRRRNK